MSPSTRTSPLALIDRSACSGCGVCGEICPRDAIQVTYVAYVDPERCSGCGICVESCPLRAIRLSARTSDQNKDGDATKCLTG